MKNAHRPSAFRPLLLALVSSSALAVATSGCGGAGGSKTGDTEKGVVLVSFEQAGEDNLPLNRVLRFDFSSPIDPLTVNPDSVQIRQGNQFGLAADGKFVVQGSTVFFEPHLPGLCDFSDAGFQPDMDYRVVFVGSPEEFAIRNLAGEPLNTTQFLSFHTRKDTDPELFEDQIPGVGPVVAFTSPTDSTADVTVGQGNMVELRFSENLDPCSISESTILFYQYAVGPFSPSADLSPGDPFTWGSGTPTTPPRRVRSSLVLTQDRLQTKITLDPVFGEFPDDALLVVQVTAGVRDFGGLACAPMSFSFTTENRAVQTNKFHMEFNGDVPIDLGQTTGEVNTARSQSKAQGYLLFAGDGDNGPYNTNQGTTRASGPDDSKGPPGCSLPSGIPQANDNLLDDFDTGVVTDLFLDTGSTRNTCLNSTDGSMAVTFEFKSFHIRPGSTVRLKGLNPAIILVQGDVVIEAGGRLLARGDGNGGSAQGNGTNGLGGQSNSSPAAGGVGVAGGGDGGDSRWQGNSSPPAGGFYSENGAAGYGSVGYGNAKTIGGGAQNPGEGFGHGAVATDFMYQLNGNYSQPTRSTPGGGGGGHANVGLPGQDQGANTGSRVKQNTFADGVGGLVTGDTNTNPANGIVMQTPEGGSGGGGGGHASSLPFITNGFYKGGGGAGGAGGGFVDVTAKGNIRILGLVDASGGRGGNGAASGSGFYGGGGGGGGGAGGAVRLLTPGMLFYDSTTQITTAGGVGGSGSGSILPDAGGMGSWGRLAIETGDGNITKSSPGSYTLNATPADGSTGFTRFPFHGQRFQGGGLIATVVTNVMDVGPSSPQFIEPVQQPGLIPPYPPPPSTARRDFVAGIPSVASRGLFLTGIFIEAKGFLANPDGSVNLASDSGWKSVGYFRDQGTETEAQWVNAASPALGDVSSLPPGNTGVDIASLNGREYIQLRITFYLPGTIGPFDPGPYIDSWDLWFTYDQ